MSRTLRGEIWGLSFAATHSGPVRPIPLKNMFSKLRIHTPCCFWGSILGQIWKFRNSDVMFLVTTKIS